MPAPSFTTDCVVIGSGPAGGSMGAFLGHYGIKGIMISKLSTTAESPRAHVTNMATMEVLRDMGLEEEAKKVANDQTHMSNTHWYESLAGDEIARYPSWGNGSAAQTEYHSASPCKMCDIAQTLMEPILQRKAVTSGFYCRFNSELVSFQQDADGVDVTVRDRIFDKEYVIRCKYLFGADGARSKIAETLGLPFTIGDGSGVNVWNLLVQADLSRFVEGRNGNLHWTFQQDHLNKDFVWVVHPRMVQPYSQWVVGFFVAPGSNPEDEVQATDADWIKRIHQFIGDDSVEVDILQKSRWQLNNSVAGHYSKGRVFCLGDAVHRHTPGGGLGSNTSIQDAYNLSWKVAFVLKGIAGPEILNSYTLERQPIGANVAKSAMEVVKKHIAIWSALGVDSPHTTSIKTRVSKLSEPSAEGRRLREQMRKAISDTRFELQGIGIEMNQHYKSNAVYLADEGAPPVIKEPLLHYEKGTYPGWRLPHAWLNSAKPGKPISTVDLAGKGRFCVLTGIGGEAWKLAAQAISQKLGVDVVAYSIGFRQDWEDPYFEWEQFRGVDETGCVLVRPDRFVAWRCQEMVPDCENRLEQVLQQVLCRDQ